MPLMRACAPGPARPRCWPGSCSSPRAATWPPSSLAGEADRRGDQRMRSCFTRRAHAGAIVAGTLSLAPPAELHASNPALYDRLTGRPLPLVIEAAVCGLAVLARVILGRPGGIRVIAALAVAAVAWGWGGARCPRPPPRHPGPLGDPRAPPSPLGRLRAV